KKNMSEHATRPAWLIDPRRRSSRSDDRSQAMTRTKFILSLGLISAIAATSGCYWLMNKHTATMNLHGTVEIQEVRLSSKIGGRIKAVLVREGDLLEPGQRLIELEAPELDAQRLQLVAQIYAATAQRDKAVSGAREEEKRGAKAAAVAAEANWQKLKAGSRP